ncbi:MAG: NAD(+)/NADH kinase [Phycisphaerales bacterium]|nr:NAD(+)/NADH kinase [Phycisphaerales bacterium]
MSRPRVLLLLNHARDEVSERLDEVRRTLGDLAEVVLELEADNAPLPTGIEADLAVVLGGDGTLLGQARRLLDLAIPMVGVNFGRLGLLAEFDWTSLVQNAEAVFGGQPIVRERMVLEAAVENERGETVYRGVAINDCVVTAGYPFRMIELLLHIDDDEGPDLTGDGVILSTPIGSTAYNVSAGGPIVHPDLDAIVITPSAAHSLAFRPIVAPGSAVLRAVMIRANPGTTLVLDGNSAVHLAPGQTVTVRRHGQRVKFVGNPSTTYWRTLLDKMRWAAPPNYRDRGR